MFENKKYFLFDIDGTIAVDQTLYDGSLELIHYIESIGGRAFYITNNSVKSRKDYVEKFSRWGIKTDEDQFMTASYATCEYLKMKYDNKKVFVVGTPSFECELRENGICLTNDLKDDIACVVVGFDQTLTYQKVQDACQLLFDNSIDFVATNPDLRCPTSFGFVPDCGSICEMIALTVDRRPLYVGKPNAEIVGLCTQQVNADPDEVLVVGDRLYTDIACGLNAKVETALVLTGEAKREDLEDTSYPPHYVFDTIRQLYEAIEKG